MMKALALWGISGLALALGFSPPPRRARAAESAAVLQIPPGPAITVDGILSPGEWDHAAHMEIAVAQGWRVDVLAQHDGRNLYFAFTGLRHGAEERYPEALLDPANEKSLQWRAGQWWLHASYNLCDAEGKPNDYSSCQPSRPGWSATRFPRTTGVSEMSISLDKVHIGVDQPFGLAVDVTDTHTQWSLWPPSALLKAPISWKTARLM